MTPRMATPPATDKPMMEPVPSPESGEEGACDDAGAELLGAAVPVKVMMTSEPLIEVKLTAAADVDPGGCGVGVTDGVADVEVVDFEVSEVVEVVVVVELAVVERSVVEVLVVVVCLSVLVAVEPGGSGSWRRSMDAEAEAMKTEKRREQKT